MLRELIKAIYVEAPDKSSGKRRQKIHIEYDGIGFIPLEELAKKEGTVKKRPKATETPQAGKSRLYIITWHGYLYVIYEYYKATR